MNAQVSDETFADVAAATALPIACADLTFAPFNGSYPNLERHMVEAKLYECKNNWDKVLDCTFKEGEAVDGNGKTKSMSWKKFRSKRIFAKKEKNNIEITTKVRKLSMFSKVAIRRAVERFDTVSSHYQCVRLGKLTIRPWRILHTAWRCWNLLCPQRRRL